MYSRSARKAWSDMVCHDDDFCTVLYTFASFVLSVCYTALYIACIHKYVCADHQYNLTLTQFSCAIWFLLICLSSNQILNQQNKSDDDEMTFEQFKDVSYSLLTMLATCALQITSPV
jgi:hypothetical protein